MMRTFEPGQTYGVLHLDDRRESVTVVARDANTVTLSDGRKARVLAGVAPDGGDEEVIRLGECGAVAVDGLVRVCHRLAAAEIGGE